MLYRNVWGSDSWLHQRSKFNKRSIHLKTNREHHLPSFEGHLYLVKSQSSSLNFLIQNLALQSNFFTKGGAASNNVFFLKGLLLLLQNLHNLNIKECYEYSFIGTETDQPLTTWSRSKNTFKNVLYLWLGYKDAVWEVVFPLNLTEIL